MFKDPSRCANRRTAAVPVFGAPMTDSACSLKFPDPSPEGGSSDGSGNGENDDTGNGNGDNGNGGESGTGNGSNSNPDSNDEQAACFPANATVMLQSGGHMRMNDLPTGALVSVGHGEFSAVFGFTHRDASIRFGFVEITTATGQTLRVTKGHYVYCNGGVVVAEKVNVGDEMMLSDGRVVEVRQVGRVEDIGLFNPQTVKGDIVVDEVLVTTYTAAVGIRIGHSLLAPLRAARLLHNALMYMVEYVNSIVAGA